MILDYFSQLINQQFFNISVLQVLIVVSAIFIGWFIGKIIAFIFAKYIGFIAQKTKTNIDDLIVFTLKRPLIWIFPLIAAFLALKFANITEPFLLQSIQNILNVLVIFWVSWVLIKFADGLILFYLKPFAEKTESTLDDQLIPVLRTVTKIAILLFALVIILDSFGYDVTALLAGIGIGGIAIAFAAQETIADVFGGISLFASRPFTIGDYVQAASIEGTVKEIGLRNTRILTPQNMLVTIPNAKIAKENIINFSKAIPRGIDLTLNLTYDTKPEQLKKAIQIVTNIIKEHPDCEKEPIVVFKNFGSSSLDLFVRYFIINPRTPKGTKMPKILQVTNEINFRILEEFNKAGIEFAYPTQTIYLKKSD